MGVTVGSDSEMTPRQQIANVGYAINAETLQGFPHGISTANIPYINQVGDMIIGVSAPGIRSTYASATFQLTSANAVTLQAAGAGDVVIQATESGTIRLRTAGTTDANTRLFIANNGNVGIGTTAPSALLDIAGNASSSGNVSFRGQGTAHTLNVLNDGTLNIQRSVGGDEGLTSTIFKIGRASCRERV